MSLWKVTNIEQGKIRVLCVKLHSARLKTNSSQFLTENLPATWQQLNDHVATIEVSFAVRRIRTGTASRGVDNM